MSLFLNKTTPILQIRVLTYWRGIWQAEADCDISSDQPLPTGPCTITVLDQTLTGTIEPTGTGRMGEKATVRIIGGFGGWGKTLVARDYHNDAQVLASTVIQTTAAEAGETIADLPPTPLGTDYTRPAGRASQVFDGLDWYVDFQGVTHGITRPAAIPSDDVFVQNFDPLTRMITASADSLIVPGTSFTDPKFGTVIARDIEQTFSAEGGSQVQIWTGTAIASQSADALLETFVKEVIGLPYLKRYRYRIQSQGVDGRLQLQIVSPLLGLPNQLPLSVWPGVPGMTAKYPLTGAIVQVAFLEGDRTKPVVVGFDPNVVPQEQTFQSLIAMSILSTLVTLGDSSATPLAHSTEVIEELTAIAAACTTLGGLLENPPTSVVFAAFAPAAAAIFNALGALIPSLLITLPTLKVKGT